MGKHPGTATVVAARAGDQAALDELVAGYLPLVYNIVGRALAGHADVDDVVQETMLRVVNGLGQLRDPASFRSWLVAIAVRQVRDHGRRTAQAPAGELAPDAADPGSDFVDLTLLRLELSGQRREVAEATRWIDDGDRELLSLWWLEASGELTRAELAGALGITPQHAAVRVQRCKARLETARTVVRVLRAQPRCGELALVLHDWHRRPDTLWRKRIAQHTRDCRRCEPAWRNQVPAERLLAGLALVLPPVALLPRVLATSASPARPPQGWRALLSKPVTAGAAAVVAVTVGTAVYASTGGAPTALPAAQVADAPPTATSTFPTGTSSTSSAAKPSATVLRAGTTQASSSAAAPSGPRYGSVVDTVDKAPNPLTPPKALPVRPAKQVAAVGGQYANPQKGWIGGTYVMMRRGDHVVLSGRGYIRVRYEIAWFNRPGGMVMPTWTGLTGKLFHVASGGQRRMDDTHPGSPANYTWMGQPTVGSSGPAAGYVVLPPGAQQMWQNEYFYLDGEVTLNNNERGADYNITATPVTWNDVTADITTPPPTGAKGGWVRYGLVRDTGDDGTPVPQYLTRATPADPAQVPQQSSVG
ncbi:RNA polymerase sigma factor [Kutzneria sp. CA-103260]|uniref:RNA polymerase sigma factor n=1 Tax=Kutzneria sp. CA-103260 TaxID=2802641 RepID=UPI001BAC555B|nr:sigma-70 family RNA polymerase sigma factor [Kutzneria sp. CA-103260]QUQ64424.1 sigma-70 family RNA polymerase sigma factor [Kutzneria sp. CA-103260]